MKQLIFLAIILIGFNSCSKNKPVLVQGVAVTVKGDVIPDTKFYIVRGTYTPDSTIGSRALAEVTTDGSGAFLFTIPREATGLVNIVNAIPAKAGNYGKFTLPQGSTGYNAEKVTVTGH